MTDYILVPVEPTAEMMEAGGEWCGQDLDRDEARGRAVMAYKAMLAAAPDHIADTRKMVAPAVRGELEGVHSLLVECERALCCPDPAQRQVTASKILRMLAASTAPAVQGEPVGLSRFIEMIEARASIRKSGMIDGITLLRDLRAMLAATPSAPQPTPRQECGGDGAGGEHEDDCAMAQHAEQPECGCCGRTDRCDDDCDAVVIGGHRAAEQPDVTLLLSLLSHARCNTCDGSGGLYDNHGQPHQCQWCRERSEALAAHRKQPEGEA